MVGMDWGVTRRGGGGMVSLAPEAARWRRVETGDSRLPVVWKVPRLP